MVSQMSRALIIISMSAAALSVRVSMESTINHVGLEKDPELQALQEAAAHSPEAALALSMLTIPGQGVLTDIACNDDTECTIGHYCSAQKYCRKAMTSTWFSRRKNPCGCAKVNKDTIIRENKLKACCCPDYDDSTMDQCKYSCNVDTWKCKKDGYDNISVPMTGLADAYGFGMH
mmetsp:Transcript_91968/g.168624  ORF Transcript_91968/g.168624 Transcript_91968/m.168624 type:complete len:175 (-) Transcript_91968:54-578(-)